MHLSGDYICRVHHGAKSLHIADFVPDKFDSLTTSIPPVMMADENFLGNAYVTLYSKHATLRIGKQQLSWGPGYSWNPTDIFNAKNQLDPTYEKVGMNAFKLEVPFGVEGMATAIVSTGQEWESSIKGLKIKYHLTGFDLSASFVEKMQERIDYLSVSSIAERRRLLGGDFSGEVFGLGVWGEGAFNQMEVSEHFGQYLIGSDYTFESGLYFTGEYCRNGMGRKNPGQYSLNDWMRFLSTDGENLGQDYIFLGEMYPIAELLNWSNYAIVNLSDRSGTSFTWFDYNLNDNTEVTLVGYIPFGKEETEFGAFGTGGFARLRVYF